MTLKKRALDDSSTSQQRKKIKHTENVVQEVDFPRGGGTTLTPLQVKSIRAEAVKEADEELFTVISSYVPCGSSYMISGEACQAETQVGHTTKGSPKVRSSQDRAFELQGKSTHI